MKLKAWRLPWQGELVPHGLLDILRGCNLSCRACYNAPGSRVKSLEQVREEFEILMRSRRLDSLGIVGGEPLLHPQLTDIIRMIRSTGVNAEVFTNGLLLDDERAAALKKAGAGLVFLHIDAHQNRPDWPQGSDGSLEDLWSAKAAAATSAGLEVGLAVTAYADALDRIDQAITFVLNSPHVDYLLVTLCRDVQAMGRLTGDLKAGISGAATIGAESAGGHGLTNQLVFERMQSRFGLYPFAYLGSNVDRDDPRWLTYVIGSALANGRPATWSMLKASATERLFLWLFRRLHGRFPFYLRQSPGKFRIQLLLNALTGGRFRGNLRLLIHSFGHHRILKTKRILFQCPAQLAPDGRLIHCSHCPDATVRHGRLTPVCISDQMDGEQV